MALILRFPKPLLLLLAIALAPSTSRAQDSLKESETASILPVPLPQRGLTLLVGAAPTNLHDAAMSTLRYGGGPFAVRTAYHKTNRRFHRSAFVVDAAFGRMQAAPNAQFPDLATAQVYRVALQYQYLVPVSKWSGRYATLHLGGHAGFLGDVRLAYQLDNSFAAYMASFGTGLSALWEVPFDLFDRTWKLDLQVDLPVLQRVWRPDPLNRYDFLETDFELLSASLDGGQWAFWNRAFRTHFQSRLRYPIRGGNALLLAYGWDFNHLADQPRYTGASHRIQGGLLWSF